MQYRLKNSALNSVHLEAFMERKHGLVKGEKNERTVKQQRFLPPLPLGGVKQNEKFSNLQLK